MNNFNDEGRVYSRLLCESPFWWASAIFGLNLPITPTRRFWIALYFET
jgi:hypothetical protein